MTKYLDKLFTLQAALIVFAAVALWCGKLSELSFMTIAAGALFNEPLIEFIRRGKP